MKSIRAVVVMLALAARAASTLAQLRGVDELRSWFNSYQGHPRLIFLVSPT